MQDNSKEKVDVKNVGSSANETEVNKPKKESEPFKIYTDALAKMVNEINEVSRDYSQKYESFQKALKNFENYVQSKTSRIEALLQEKKEVIQAKWKDLEKAEADLEKAEADLKKAKADSGKKQEEFNTTKNQKEEIEAKIEELKNLANSINKEEDKIDPQKKYLQIFEMKNLLSQLSAMVKTEKEFETELFKKWGDLQKAEVDVSMHDERVKTLKDNCAKKKEILTKED